MFEGIAPIHDHEVILPSGEKTTVKGTRRGTVERPTISGTDEAGHLVEVNYDTVDDQLVVIGYKVDGEEKLNIPPMAA